MNIIITSNPTFYIGEKKKIKAIKCENKELIGELKNCVKKYNSLLFICSNCDDYTNNEMYANTIEKSLSLAGIKFETSDLLDSRNALFSRSLIKNADLIVFLGGNPLDQMEFFNAIEIKEKFKNYKGTLMTISAGSINMGNHVYCSKDDSIENTIYYKGLGYINFCLETHFDANNTDRINNILLKDSEKRPFVALPNESFIKIENKQAILFNEAYYFSEGNYKKINSLENISK